MTPSSRKLLGKLERVDEAKLTDDERITLAILEHLLRQEIDALPHFWLRSPVTPYASPISQINQIFLRRELATDDDKARYLHLLDEHARFIDDIANVVREQQRRGILLPKAEITIARTLFTTAPLARPDDRVRETIAQKNEPAMARLAAIFSAEYEAAAPESVGIGQYPGGAEAYRFLVRGATTTNLTPEEIHQMECARWSGSTRRWLRSANGSVSPARRRSFISSCAWIRASSRRRRRRSERD